MKNQEKTSRVKGTERKCRLVIEADETVTRLVAAYRSNGIDPNAAVVDALHREAKRLSRRDGSFFCREVGVHKGGIENES